MFNRNWKWDIWFQNSFYYRSITKPSRAFAPTLVFRNVTSANWSIQATAIRVIFRLLKFFSGSWSHVEWYTWYYTKLGLKFLNYWFLNLLNPQLKSMKARIEKSKTKLKKKRIEKPSFYLFPKTFTFGARLTPTKWLAFCKICFIHVGLLSNSSFELFP